MSTTRSRVCVIGLGNLLLGDEGIGVHTVGLLDARYTFTPAVDLVDGGTLGLDLLPVLEMRDRVLLIDAADFGRPPGHIGFMEGFELPAALSARPSVHHIGLSDLFSAASLLGIRPSSLRLIGVQPLSLELKIGLSGPVAGRMEALIEAVLETLKEWHVTATPK
jgi:hydrogenase maturation protease